MDGMNVLRRTRDIVIVGKGKSTLEAVAAAAAREQGRVIKYDPKPEKGFYYRSDHFSFAKVGVPALDPDAGTDFVGKPAGWGYDDAREVHKGGLSQAVRRDLSVLEHERRRRRPPAIFPDRQSRSERSEAAGMEARK